MKKYKPQHARLLFIDRRIHNVGQTNLGLNLMNVPVEVYVPKGMQRAR